MPSVNFKDVPTMEAFPNGTYEAQFDSFENDLASTDGSDMVKMEFVITQEDEYKGRKAWKNHSLKPSALWAFKRTALALGTNPEVFEDEEDVDTDDLLADLQGAPCRLVIKRKLYEGEWRSEIKSVLPPSYEFAS